MILLVPVRCFKVFRPKLPSRVISSVAQPRQIENRKLWLGNVPKLAFGSFLATALIYSCVLVLTVTKERNSAISHLQAVVEEFIGESDHGNYNKSRKGAESSTSAVQLLSESILHIKTPVYAPLLADENHIRLGPPTIVTAFFALRSKHSLENYKKWMKNLLEVRDPMVIFTQNDMIETMTELRRHAQNQTLIVQLNIQDLPISRYRGHYPNSTDFWQQQLDRDREKRLHRGYEVFWIWLSKSWFVVQATELNPFNSNIFMYCDIGSFRQKQKALSQNLVQWPESVLVDRETVVWMAHRKPNPPPNPIWNDKFGQREHYYHSGSQAIGYWSAWQRFHSEFAIVLDEFVKADLFIGEDQCVLQGTCQRRPKYCAYVPFDQVTDNRYFGLRTVVRHGGNYNLWRAPDPIT